MLASGEVYYHLTGAPSPLPAGPLKLDSALALPHVAGESVVARTPLLTVHALDAGAWGNRLRVAVHDNDPPLVKTKIRAVLDGTHLRLDSPNGVEPGTILSRVDATGTVLESVKVQSINRQNDFLITLDAAVPLSGGAAVGDFVRSQEFQLDVVLMRQPDPAVPTRAAAVLTGESFSYLSLDPRHSRYVHKVIGTTWAPGALVDDDGNPLRKSDERSEGTSWLVRVRDEEADPVAQLGDPYGSGGAHRHAAQRYRAAGPAAPVRRRRRNRRHQRRDLSRGAEHRAGVAHRPALPRKQGRHQHRRLSRTDQSRCCRAR